MDNTILAVLITAGLGLLGSYMAVRTARHTEEEKAEIARNTNSLAATKVVVDGLHDHLEVVLAENRDLRSEVAWCRANHSQRGKRAANDS